MDLTNWALVPASSVELIDPDDDNEELYQIEPSKFPLLVSREINFNSEDALNWYAYPNCFLAFPNTIQVIGKDSKIPSHSWKICVKVKDNGRVGLFFKLETKAPDTINLLVKLFLVTRNHPLSAEMSTQTKKLEVMMMQNDIIGFEEVLGVEHLTGCDSIFWDHDVATVRCFIEYHKEGNLLPELNDPNVCRQYCFEALSQNDVVFHCTVPINDLKYWSDEEQENYIFLFRYQLRDKSGCWTSIHVWDIYVKMEGTGIGIYLLLDSNPKFYLESARINYSILIKHPLNMTTPLGTGECEEFEVKPGEKFGFKDIVDLFSSGVQKLGMDILCFEFKIEYLDIVPKLPDTHIAPVYISHREVIHNQFYGL